MATAGVKGLILTLTFQLSLTVFNVLYAIWILQGFDVTVSLENFRRCVLLFVCIERSYFVDWRVSVKFRITMQKKLKKFSICIPMPAACDRP